MNSINRLIVVFIWTCVVSSSYQVNWQGDWAMGCDFRVGQALKDIKVSGDQCGSRCASTPGCTHYTWNNYNGGTCWMKSGGASKSDAFDADSSMVCGVISSSPNPNPNPNPNLDSTSHPLKGLYGVAYSCSNPSIKYCDDWFTAKYKSIYNNPSSQRSLQSLKKLGFNIVRTYYLDPNQDHNDFLSLCDSLNLAVEIGIANGLLDKRDSAGIVKLVNQVKSHKSVKIYTVGNEYRGSTDNIVFAMQAVFGADSSKYIMHSSIFDANFATAANIYLKVPANIKSKYIVGVNMYFYGNAANTIGAVISNVVKEFFSNQAFKNAFLVISEYGTNDNDPMRISSFNQGIIQCLQNYKNFLGYELFAYSDETWKGAANGENNYGIITENGAIKSTYSAVTAFQSNNGFKSVIKSNL